MPWYRMYCINRTVTMLGSCCGTECTVQTTLSRCWVHAVAQNAPYKQHSHDVGIMLGHRMHRINNAVTMLGSCHASPGTVLFQACDGLVLGHTLGTALSHYWLLLVNLWVSWVSCRIRYWVSTVIRCWVSWVFLRKSGLWYNAGTVPTRAVIQYRANIDPAWACCLGYYGWVCKILKKSIRKFKLIHNFKN